MVRLTVLCARHPWATVVVVLLLTGLAAWSRAQTGTAVGTDANLGSGHPAVTAFRDFLGRFGGGYPIVIAFECDSPIDCQTVFEPESLLMAASVSTRLLEEPFVARVSSPATTRLLVPSDGFGLSARQFVVDGQVVDDPELLQQALSDPLWSRSLVSGDGRVGAIVVELNSTNGQVLESAILAARRAIEPFDESGFDFHIVGEAAMSIAAQETGRDSATRAAAFTGGMLLIVLLLLLRSIPAVLASLCTIGIAAVWMTGILPLIGWQQSHLTGGAATLILVIGCADCIHFVSRYLEIRDRFPDIVGALAATSQWVVGPCLLTTATTAGAFLSFATGDALAVTQFGVLAAIGVTIVFALTFSFFPALLTLFRVGPRRPKYSAAWQEVLSRIASTGVRRRKLILFSSIALAGVGAAGIPKLVVEMNIVSLWAPDHPVRRAIEFVSEHLQGVDRIEIEMTLGEDEQIENPETLQVLVSAEERLLALNHVQTAQSLLSVLRHAHDIVSGPSDNKAELPRSEAGVGELLFFVSSGAPGTLDPWVTLDNRHVRVSLEVSDVRMAEKELLLREVEEVLSASVPAGWTYFVTGPVVLAHTFGKGFTQGQVRIVIVSTILVVSMIAIYLGSLPWALLAAIPNAVALMLMFGTMGHWGIFLNFGSAIVAPIAIGIAADDTIHFLTVYARERRAGKGPVPASKSAIVGVGEPVIATAMALSLGFLSMMTSPMATVADMGLLCAIAILGATLADLLMLPALIATVAEWKGFAKLPETHV